MTSSARVHTVLAICIPLSIHTKGRFPISYNSANTFSKGEVMKNWLVEWLNKKSAEMEFGAVLFHSSWGQRSIKINDQLDNYHKLKNN